MESKHKVKKLFSSIRSRLLGSDQSDDGVDDKKIAEDKYKTEMSEEILVSPLSGEVIPLKDVDDPFFSSGDMGLGIAILPKEGKLYSPVDGEVTVVFPTGHAIGIVSQAGAEVLIHIGINTVELNGMHFNTLINQGQTVKTGELIAEFEVEKIKEAGYDLSTPILVTNSAQYKTVIPFEKSSVTAGDELLKLEIN